MCPDQGSPGRSARRISSRDSGSGVRTTATAAQRREESSSVGRELAARRSRRRLSRPVSANAIRSHLHNTHRRLSGSTLSDARLASHRRLGAQSGTSAVSGWKTRSSGRQASGPQEPAVRIDGRSRCSGNRRSAWLELRRWTLCGQEESVSRRAGASSWDDRDEPAGLVRGGQQSVSVFALAPKVLIRALLQVSRQPSYGGVEDRLQLGRAGPPGVHSTEGMPRAINGQ